MKRMTIVLALAVLSTAALTQAAPIMLDYGTGGSGVEAGFDQATETMTGLTGPNGETAVSVTLSGNGGARSRGKVDDDIIDDFVFYSDNDNPLTVTIGGLQASTAYEITLWTCDSDYASRSFTITDVTGGASNELNSISTNLTGSTDVVLATYPRSFWETNEVLTSDANGNIALGIVGGSGVNLINGLVVAVPEPATMSLLGLGGLVALRRRRHA